MSTLSARFNTRVPWPFRYGVVVVIGLGLAFQIPRLWFVGMKIAGLAPGCSWQRVITLPEDTDNFADRVGLVRGELQRESRDEAFGIELIRHRDRRFWIRGGQAWNEKQLLAYLIAEQQYAVTNFPDLTVQSGDIVLDCGAHVGVFSARALEAGAEKVVCIEPDPTQLECLRRNFVSEIAEGKVLIVPKAVWSSTGTMRLTLGTVNSGMTQLAEIGAKEGDLEVPVTTIDDLVGELQLARVDFVKLDIEGAEREALKGARRTLATHRPRLFVDSYHRADDVEVLSEIITSANPSYEMTCGFCRATTEFGNWLLVPHYVFYH